MKGFLPLHPHDGREMAQSTRRRKKFKKNQIGQFRPFTRPVECCGAARRLRHSPQARNPSNLEHTDYGTYPPFNFGIPRPSWCGFTDTHKGRVVSAIRGDEGIIEAECQPDFLVICAHIEWINVGTNLFIRLSLRRTSSHRNGHPHRHYRWTPTSYRLRRLLGLRPCPAHSRQ